MTMPKFTGEASLYQTSGHYQTDSQALHGAARMTEAIHPARDEVIEVGGCHPGTYKVELPDGSYECWSNPDPWSGGEGSGGSQGAGGEPGVEKPPPGGGGTPPKDKPDKPRRIKTIRKVTPPKGYKPKEGRTCYGLRTEITAGGDPIIWDDPFKGKYTRAGSSWFCEGGSASDHVECNKMYVWTNGDQDIHHCYNKKPPYPPV